MAATHDPTTRNEIAALVVELLEIGTAFPTVDLLIYGPTGQLLGTLPMGSPAFQPPVDGIAVANNINQALPVAGGQPTSWRIRGKDGVFRLSGSMGQLGSGADLEGQGDIIPGRPIVVQSLAYSAPP